jgi:mono/diheme cytochrome c family protein
LVVAFSAAGCGAVKRVTEGDPSRGKQLFLDPKVQCASCHTLADAKSQGKLGPNLDDAFASTKAQGFDQSTITDVVRGQIAYPEEPMPANLAEGQDADDIAVYIAKCSGNAHCGVTAARTSATPAPGGGTTTTAQGGGGAAKPDGKAIFASAGCGSCHTLKAAGSTGNVGPNLDALKPSEPTVEKQVTNGGGGMPPFKGQLSAAQIKAVAAYVASTAGK